MASTSGTGLTALHCAAEKGFLDLVNLPLDHNEGAELFDAACSLVELAVQGGNQRVVKRPKTLGIPRRK